MAAEDARRPGRRAAEPKVERIAPPPRDRHGRAPRRRAPHRARAARPPASSASSASARATACTSTRPAATCSSAPTARTPGPTARPTCSSSAASRRATTRRCRGCSARGAGRRGSRPTGHGARFELGDEVVLSTRRDAGPLKVHFFTHATPAARLRAFLRLTGLPPRAARVGVRALEEPRRLQPPDRGGGRLRRLPRARPPARRDRARLPVGDAIQHVGVQPAPVPGRRGHDRSAGGRTACAPWCGSRRG